MTPRLFRDCWLLFGGVDDIGYSHSMNLGRLQVNRHLQQTLSTSNNDTTTTPILLESKAYHGVFFMPPDERELLVNQTIQDGCHLIVTSSAGLLDEYAYARAYPNISFVGAGGTAPPGTPLPPNLVEYQLDWFSAAFVSGAVAAAVTQRCAGFITAFEDRSSTWSHTMGFVLGYQWWRRRHPPTNNNNSTDVHVVTMNSYFSPIGEKLAAQQLVESKGCDVIARHTDPNNVDKYILELPEKNALSIARYVDMSTFVGDSVFTSQVRKAGSSCVGFALTTTHHPAMMVYIRFGMPLRCFYRW